MSRSRCAGDARAARCTKIIGTLTAALMVLLAGVGVAQNSPDRTAGLDARSGAERQPPDPAGLDRFVTEVERRLKTCHERLAAIGPTVLAALNDLGQAKDQLTDQMITTESAKANFGNAKLTREVAEIAVVEYQEGIFIQDQATIEGELKLAESAWLRAKAAVEGTQERLRRIKAASKGTAADVAVEFAYEDNVLDAAQREPKAKIAISQAEAKLRKLRQYTKLIRIKELQSEVEKARADELRKKADWQMEKTKSDRLSARIQNSDSAAPGGLPLALLTQAFSVDEQIRAELGELPKNRSLDLGHAKKITNLVTQLEGMVNQAEAELLKARVERMKASIQGAAIRFGVAKP
jgi:hypothetical protein